MSCKILSSEKMKVKNVLMIAAVFLAMLIVPVAADESASTSVSLSSAATFELDIPTTGVDLNSGAADATAGIKMKTIAPGSLIELSVDSSNGFKLVHTYDSQYSLPYTVTADKANVVSGDVILFGDAGNDELQSVELSFTANLDDLTAAGNYKDTLTFTAKERVPTVVNTADDLKAALSSSNTNGEPVYIDAGNTDIGTLGGAVYPDNSVIKNAVVSERNYGGDAHGTVTFIGCEFNNPSGAYSVHFDKGSDDSEVIFENCKLSGWCSFGTAVKKVTLIDCQISGNGIYGMVRFYQDTELIGCTIDCASSNSDDIYVDGISAVNGATVTLTDCTITNTALEVSDNAKIVVNGDVKADSVNGDEDGYLLIQSGSW